MMASLLQNLLCAVYFIGIFPQTISVQFTQNEQSANTQQNVTCPTDKPFVMKNGTITVCVSSCRPGMVIDGFKCINVTDCQRPVLSDGRCMDLCPEGYLYINPSQFSYDGCGEQYSPCSYTTGDITAHPCVKKSYLTCYVIVYVIGIITYILFVLMFFSTWSFSFTKLITCVRSIKRQKMTSSDDTLLINADDTDE